MIHDKLKMAYESFVEWCDAHDVLYDIVCDEDDLQGFLVPKQYRSLTPRLSRFMQSVAVENDLHCAEYATRSGTILSISLNAISESTLESMVPPLDQSRFSRKLDLVFDGMVNETGFHSPSTAMRRQYARPTETIGSKLTKKLRESLGYLSIGQAVNEALDGIAADYQPMDVLKHFESALRDLGLLDSLKAAEVTNKLSSDRQVIHFYISDADGRQREVASYELIKLAEGNNMEKAIKDLVDISRKRAPGTADREAQHVKDREQYIRDVAKQYSLDGEEEQQAPGQQAVGSVPVESISPQLRKLITG